jgi:hypothetical protein
MKIWLIFLQFSKPNLDRSQQEASAPILHNSAVGKYSPPSPKKVGLKTAASVLVLLHNGGFCNACTMKWCLHRKVDFKTNLLNNAYASQLLHYKAGLLQNDGITLYFKIKANSLQVNTSHRKLLVKVS